MSNIMNEVSIIINGVRYDAYAGYCSSCDLNRVCYDNAYNICEVLGVPYKRFVKSDKKFEV